MTPEQQKQLLVRILERIALELDSLVMSSEGMSTSGVADLALKYSTYLGARTSGRYIAALQDDIRKYEEEVSA
jgi:hypothetical protein